MDQQNVCSGASSGTRNPLIGGGWRLKSCIRGRGQNSGTPPSTEGDDGSLAQKKIRLTIDDVNMTRFAHSHSPH